jgi:hypothetical protein
MKRWDSLSGIILLVLSVAGFQGLSGCASTRARNTESLLSAAGFRTVTPKTPQQQTCYEALPARELQRREAEGKVTYAYADKKEGILYVGNEQNYQRFQELAHQERVAEQQLQAAQMNQTASINWSFWGPASMWW